MVEFRNYLMSVMDCSKHDHFSRIFSQSPSISDRIGLRPHVLVAIISKSERIESINPKQLYTIVALMVWEKHQAGSISIWLVVYLYIKQWMQSMVNRLGELVLVRLWVSYSIMASTALPTHFSCRPCSCVFKPEKIWTNSTC